MEMYVKNEPHINQVDSSEAGISLYVHIPFCKQKCLYCDFPSYCGVEELMVPYAKALADEIKTLKNITFKSIFIGGGTPTYLSLEALKIIKDAVLNLSITKDMEFTVEGNPGTFTIEKLKIFKEMGVNRLSIGLQATQDCILKKIGRIHSYEDFLKSYKMARDMNFKNINIDLMFGLPEQNLEQWKETLEKVTDLNPEHLSCYGLIVEEDTAFYNLDKQNKLKLPEEDIEREMYNLTLEYLKEKGYNQYEISNFSKPNKMCRHNLVYFGLQEYIGVGAASHSYYEGYRYSHSKNIKDYIKSNSDKIEIHKNRIEDDMEEFMFMGLRKIQGISIEEFEKRFKKEINFIYGDIIEKYKRKNLLIENLGFIRLSKVGIEISNQIMSEFILEKYN